MKVTLEIEDNTSITGGDPDVLRDLLANEAVLELELLLEKLDPDHHDYYVYVREVER